MTESKSPRKRKKSEIYNGDYETDGNNKKVSKLNLQCIHELYYNYF